MQRISGVLDNEGCRLAITYSRQSSQKQDGEEGEEAKEEAKEREADKSVEES